jgi:hypothetical protein
MVFDTTSSNTGKHAGSCISLESALGRSIMWLACRHHVYEIHMKHVSDHINGARNSPSDSLCVRFQKDFNSLDKSTEVIANLSKLIIYMIFKRNFLFRGLGNARS